jgi:hypothetical protein
MHICYLDFDGVLHDSSVWLTPDRGIILDTPGRRLFEWESILINLLAPHPDLKIVLSTSWVTAKGFSFAKEQLHSQIGARVIGATFDERSMAVEKFKMQPRSAQVLADANRRQPSDWFAIDDDGFGWPAWARNKLVLTKGISGLRDIAVQTEIRRRLAGWEGGPASSSSTAALT